LRRAERRRPAHYSRTLLADWLERLDMADYAERFSENRIDFSALPELSDQDLKELGVLLGDRRKLLRAIRESAACKPAAQSRQPPSPS
jgi:hypothetical protein